MMSCVFLHTYPGFFLTHPSLQCQVDLSLGWISLVYCILLTEFCSTSTVSDIDLAWFSSLTSDASVSLVFIVLYIFLKNFLVNWTWCDWPLTRLSNHCPLVMWHCWLGHLNHKIVPEMTSNVLSAMLNATVVHLIYYYLSFSWLWTYKQLSYFASGGC